MPSKNHMNWEQDVIELLISWDEKWTETGITKHLKNDIKGMVNKVKIDSFADLIRGRLQELRKTQLKREKKNKTKKICHVNLFQFPLRKQLNNCD